MKNKKKQEYLIDYLNKIGIKNALIRHNMMDIDLVSYNKIKRCVKLLDEVIARILYNQKKRGKEFLSNEDIDKILDKIFKEEQV